MQTGVLLLAVTLGCAAAAAQSTEHIELLSVDGAGAQAGNGASTLPEASADGRTVVFTSGASNLVTNDANGALSDVFVRDLQTNETTLVSVNGAGTSSGDGASGAGSITPDGRFVLFVSEAGDLVAGDTNGKKDVFVRDLSAQTTTLVSVNGAGTGAGGDESFGARMTPDGRFVVFSSRANDLVGNDHQFTDVFRRDLLAGTTILISINRAGTAGGNAPSSGNRGGTSVLESSRPGSLSITPDGRYVLFLSGATDLVELDTSPSVQNCFRRDVQTETTALVSVNSAGSASSNGFAITPLMSDDGQVVVFESQATDLVPDGEIGPDASIYVRDFTTGTTTLISQRGVPGVSGTGRSTSPRISSDGRYVYFLRADSLFQAFGAQDPEKDKIFRRDRQTGELLQLPIVIAGICAVGHDCAIQNSNLTTTADGRYVAYGQLELHRNAPPGAPLLHSTGMVIHDVVGGGVEHVSGTFGDHTDGFKLLSPGNIVAGPKLFFSSGVRHSGKDTNHAEDVYVFAPSAQSKLVFIAASGFSREASGGLFVVRRMGLVTDSEATIDFATSDGTARAGSDYTAVSGTLTFGPGETSKVIVIPFLDDEIVEPDETVILTLSNPRGADATLGPRSSALLSIVNDDVYVLNFSAGTAGVSETARSVTVTVTLAGGTPHGGLGVSFSTFDGTASDRSDYMPVMNDSLRFAPDEDTKTITVPLTDDAYREDAETFSLELIAGSGATIGDLKTVTVTILSDDAADGPTPVRDATFNAEFFVRQHYLDFLNREPDAPGLQFWTNQITECETRPAPERQGCREIRRINVSAAFFQSIEFQRTGFLVYLVMQAAFDVREELPLRDRPFAFLPAVQAIGRGVVMGQPGADQLLEQNRQTFFNKFVETSLFRTVHPQGMTAAQFVNALNTRTGNSLSPAERDALVADLASGAKTRAQVLRAVCEDADFIAREKNRAFVLMQYFGYLRRTPNQSPNTNFDGYNFWLAKLDEFGGDFVRAEMVKAFINSDEYLRRFGR